MNKTNNGPNKQLRELNALCGSNGRVLSFMKDGRIVTQERYDGTDAHYFDSYDEAIQWEKDYIRINVSEEDNIIKW